MARVDGSNARQLSDDGLDAENPQITPDGEWVVYWSANPDKLGVWKIRPDGSEATHLVPAPSLFAELSPDGRHVAYVVVASDRLVNSIHVAEVATGRVLPFEIEVSTSLSAADILFGRPRWLPDGSGIAYVGADELDRTGIYVQDFDPQRDTSATRRPLAGFLPDATTESFGISPDGKRITLALMEHTTRLMLAENVRDVEPPR